MLAPVGGGSSVFVLWGVGGLGSLLGFGLGRAWGLGQESGFLLRDFI